MVKDEMDSIIYGRFIFKKKIYLIFGMLFTKEDLCRIEFILPSYYYIDLVIRLRLKALALVFMSSFSSMYISNATHCDVNTKYKTKAIEFLHSTSRYCKTPNCHVWLKSIHYNNQYNDNRFKITKFLIMTGQA